MTDETFKAICDDIATTTTSIEVLSRQHGVNPSTFYRRLQASDESYEYYARAKRFQMEIMAEEILLISDDSSKDKKTITTRSGEKVVVDHENIQRSKLMVDTRKFLMSQLAPMVFGSRQNVNVTSEINYPSWWSEIKKNDKPEP